MVVSLYYYVLLVHPKHLKHFIDRSAMKEEEEEKRNSVLCGYIRAKKKKEEEEEEKKKERERVRERERERERSRTRKLYFTMIVV